MIYDNLGLPKENGADDFEDSARLAGILTVFEINLEIPLDRYLSMKDSFMYIRHPISRHDFSRDQAICLVAGFVKQRRSQFVDKKFIKGKDFLPPSVTGHIKRCQGKESNWFEDLWLWLDVLWSVIVVPKEEPNQILCMMLMAPPKYLDFWLKHNVWWRESITDYWSGWRGEPELAQKMIKFLEGK